MTPAEIALALAVWLVASVLVAVCFHMLRVYVRERHHP